MSTKFFKNNSLNFSFEIIKIQNFFQYKKFYKNSFLKSRSLNRRVVFFISNCKRITYTIITILSFVCLSVFETIDQKRATYWNRESQEKIYWSKNTVNLWKNLNCTLGLNRSWLMWPNYRHGRSSMRNRKLILAGSLSSAVDRK